MKQDGHDNFFYAFDFSHQAVSVLKNNAKYDPSKCHAFVHDLSLDAAIDEIEPESLDVITLIFVLSALSPNRQAIAIAKLARLLKPGGVILFRDYGKYDLTQLRFKKDRLLDEDFYVRGDGTCVYYFTQEKVSELFGDFEKLDLKIDTRLLVNRKRKLQMHRVWLQGKFKKL
ncbi:Methyltransferase-like domain-containing protein [Rozella allomycis CSF55]|uniref:Methyltransferase-like domain-containing protein n=1 Tax=Rozella allomycis (strain CSF55) TaxID=988480 RepID=A0A075B2B7_ROZAC|nr:Methyltransferase-like domain-containing protein [Rozella allomycis CSF55]|eukprot:EPZ35076.1 Methyltransferase-like domain-containing protein [Rozella allomycis CSF55]